MSLSPQQLEQEELVHSYKYNAVAFIGIIFGGLSFFAFSAIFAPLSLFFAIVSYAVGKASWGVPAIVVTGFACFFAFMQTFGGGFLFSY